METEGLDLSTVLEPLARSRRWSSGVPRIFDGLVVVAPRGGIRSGRIATFALGPGRIAVIEGSAQAVTRTPRQNDRTSKSFNVLIQVEGTCRLEHAGRSIVLAPHCFALVDGAAAFEMRFDAAFSQILFQLPRDVVQRRHDGIAALTGRRFGRERPEAALLVAAFCALAGAVEQLDATQRAHALDACLGHLGMLTSPGLGGARDRFLRATAEIEAELSDPDLDAATIAARVGVSRRRLDMVFDEHGTTVTAWIWERRLVRVAEQLESPASSHRKLIDVALSFGFSDAAHFSRAFRRRFGVTPRTYRAAAAGR